MKIDILKVFSLLIIQPWHAVKVDDSDEDARNDGDEDGDELSALAVALSPTHDPTSVHHNVHHLCTTICTRLCTMVVGGTTAWSGDIQRAKMRDALNQPSGKRGHSSLTPVEKPNLREETNRALVSIIIKIYDSICAAGR